MEERRRECECARATIMKKHRADQEIPQATVPYATRHLLEVFCASYTFYPAYTAHLTINIPIPHSLKKNHSFPFETLYIPY